MATAQQWLDVVTNNLANASTTGFKRDGVTFNDGLVRQLSARSGGGPPIGSLGTGSVIKSFYTDFSIGTLGATGWYTSDVTVRTSGADDLSGPVTCTADQHQTNDTAGAV